MPAGEGPLIVLLHGIPPPPADRPLPAALGGQIERYIEAWSQPGAATGMINYYRSSVRTPPKRAEEQIRPISAPTLVI